jgi:inosose dehydratase
VSAVRIANAPVSWGASGFKVTAQGLGYAQVLDEIAQAGYEGTELGDWGFLPAEPERVRAELKARGLAMAGAYVPVRLADASAHGEGVASALRTARVLAACRAAGAPPPLILLADDNGVDAARTRSAGRVTPQQALGKERWDVSVEGVRRIAQAVRDEAGVRTAFHHHCAGFVETPQEIEALLEATPAELVGLCFDTGHYVYGGGDALEGLRRYAERVWHVHLKDCDGDVIARARRDELGYFDALAAGIFCELGAGAIDCSALIGELRARSYVGWIVVEHEAPPGRDTPLQVAMRNRRYLKELGL